MFNLVPETKAQLSGVPNQRMTKKTNQNRSLALTVLVALGIFVAGAIWLPRPDSNGLRPASDQVRLTKPVGDIVQMFAHPGSGADAFADFSVGTACTKLDGPMRVDFGDGMISNYYKLTCNGITGYVNVKFVR